MCITFSPLGNFLNFLPGCQQQQASYFEEDVEEFHCITSRTMDYWNFHFAIGRKISLSTQHTPFVTWNPSLIFTFFPSCQINDKMWRKIITEINLDFNLKIEYSWCQFWKFYIRQIEITFENVRSKERAMRPRVKMSRANLISLFRLKCGPQKIEKVLLMVLQFELGSL